MGTVALGLSLLALPFVGSCGETSVAAHDANGRITALGSQGDMLDVRTNVTIPVKGWGRMPSLSTARDVKHTREQGRQTWTGRIEIEPGKDYLYEQTMSEEDGAVVLDIKVTAQADVEIEGVFFWLDVPIQDFAGGQGVLSTDGREVASAELPEQKPEARHFLSGDASEVVLSDAEAKTELQVTFDRAVPVVVQDTREWNGGDFSAFSRFAPSLAAGETVTLRATLELTTEPDTTPVQLTLDADTVRYKLHGFGGNYCFNIESPVTQYTLEHLQQGWARTELTAYEWEPENDNDDPADTDWEYLKSQDKPDSNLRREFLLAKQIQDKGIPYAASIWGLPGWLYDEPVDRPRGSRRKIHPDKWDELLECLGTYFTYAKEQYGVEPDLFSFNEANIGVDVWLTAEEHREAIKRIGGHFEALGLKTKMLLADATGPRGTHTYAEPAANDPEAMKYVAAVGFHSWGGASPEEYAAWGDLAERLDLPLLVAELGVDAGAWRTQAYDSFHYALREVRMYQELLLHARPQGTQQWEFTADYGIAKAEEDEAGNETVVPTVRFHFVKHFCNLTPPMADALTTTSGSDKVLFTAFAGEVDGKPVTTLHIANLGAAREVKLAGIPEGLSELRTIRTSETEAFAELEPVTPRNGRLELKLAGLSLTTLTTGAAE